MLRIEQQQQRHDRIRRVRRERQRRAERDIGNRKCDDVCDDGRLHRRHVRGVECDDTGDDHW